MDTISEQTLRDHAAAAALAPRCAACAPLWRRGWESLTAAHSTAHLTRVGACPIDDDDPDRLAEHHPHGTRLWSPDAPIALGWHPYNRCTLWHCARCDGAFLRYTEYGGYYEDARIRALAADLIVHP